MRLLKIVISLALFSSVCHASNDDIDVSGGNVTGLNDPLESRVMLEVGDVDSHFKRTLYMFRSYVNKETLVPEYQIYFRIKGYGEKGWNTAKTLIDGKVTVFNSSTISKKTACNSYGCVVTEDVVTSIDRKSLDSMIAKEQTIRLFSGITSDREELDIDQDDAKKIAETTDKIINYLRIAKDKQKDKQP